MMQARKPMIGVALYHATDLTERPDVVAPLLAAASTAAGRAALGYVLGQFWSSDRFSRQQKLNDATLAQLLVDVRGRVFRSIQFDQVKKSEQEASGGYASLHVELRPAANPRVGSEEAVAYPYRLYLLLPEEAVDVGALRTGLGNLMSALDAPYAFVHRGADFRDALMEVVSTPMFPWGQPLSASDQQRQARLSRCQVERAKIGERICGAHWMTLLGEDLVRELGGAERVEREAPVAAVYPLDRGRLLLQLTESLPDGDVAGEYAGALARLEAFLAPVSLTGAP